MNIRKEFDKDNYGDHGTKHHEQRPAFQNHFHKDVSNLVDQIKSMGNPFIEDSGYLLTLDTKRVVSEKAIESLKVARRTGEDQMKEFVAKRITCDKENKPITDTLKRNKITLFSNTDRQIQTNDNSIILHLKADTKLFSELYISAQHRECDLSDFFRHENAAYPPSLSYNGTLRKGTKSDLVQCLLKDCELQTDVPKVDAKVFDGPTLVQMLQPRGCKTFDEYADHVFIPYIQQQSTTCKRIDVVFDVYRQGSLKQQTRLGRGMGIRRKILANTPIPTNWSGLLRVDENKNDLYSFLSKKLVVMNFNPTQICCTIAENVISCDPTLLDSSITPSTQEEADTRMLLHVYHCVKKGATSVTIRTVDTDVVILSIAYFYDLNLSTLYIAFGTGKQFKHIPVHEIAHRLGKDKSKALPMFHAITGCDTTSSFAGKGKKTAWDVWNSNPAITNIFNILSAMPKQITTQSIQAVERFIVQLYQKASIHVSCDKARHDLFTSGRSVDNIPPTSDALLQHIQRSILQAGHIWAQCLTPCPIYPDFERWGWMKKADGSYDPIWTTLPQASKACRALIRCSCKVRCSGRCQCANENLGCTELCHCKATCANCK